jgi:hypothetical protein
VLALQEASLWRIQAPSSALTGGQPPATTVLYDFIGSLLNDLAAKGLDYTVVGSIMGLWDIQGFARTATRSGTARVLQRGS